MTVWSASVPELTLVESVTEGLLGAEAVNDVVFKVNKPAPLAVVQFAELFTNDL